NHARTYLHLTGQNKLIELPVAWYSENGGDWGMKPGDDRRDQSRFRRKKNPQGFFFLKPYPSTKHDTDRPHTQGGPQSAALREGIDCQRCHGPGSAHLRAPSATNIVNPARFPPDRKLELCMQCHLETTSEPLPYAVRRFGRGVFSYKPGEPLSEYML